MEEGWRFREMVASHITESSSSIVVIFPSPDPPAVQINKFHIKFKTFETRSTHCRNP